MGRIEKRRSTTLGGVFLRYVLVVLGALFILVAGVIFTFSILVNTGYIYPANYTEQKINEEYEQIRNADEVTEDMIPRMVRNSAEIWQKSSLKLPGMLQRMEKHPDAIFIK